MAQVFSPARGFDPMERSTIVGRLSSVDVLIKTTVDKESAPARDEIYGGILSSGREVVEPMVELPAAGESRYVLIIP